MTTILSDTLASDSNETAESTVQIASEKASRLFAPKRDRRVVLAGLLGLVILAVLLFEFVFGSFMQQRSQAELLNEFRNTLATSASAYGQPGLSPLPGTAPALGSAVAFVQIPSLGVSQVVAEGTASQVTQTAPGHVPGTALPGQAGEAVIVGRRTTFGAPFYSVPNLKTGATILVTTVEGTSKYEVIQPIADSLPANRLVLRTSNPPLLSLGAKDVYAQLQGLPYVATPKNSPDEPHQSPWPAVVIAIQLVAISFISVRFSNNRFSRTVTWLLCTPLVFGAVLALALAVNSLLPSTV
jgi:sortase A